MVTEPASDPAPQPSHDSNLIWMVRGMMLSVLVLGSANALSFFFRSNGWGSLLGSREPADEAIGFPLTVWQEAQGYGSHTLKVVPFLVDIASVLILGVIIGLIAIAQKRTLNQIMDRFRSSTTQQKMRVQFSLRGLMMTTVLVALAAAVARSFTPRVEVLAAIYALGPIFLIGLAFLPRQLSWQQRVAILTPAALMLIAVAMVLGFRLGVEFDKVMMGIFICWTPQSAVAAIVITIALLMREYRALANGAGQQPH